MDFIPHISQDTANSADTNSDVDISVNEPIVRDQSEIRLVREPSAYRLYADRPKTNLIPQDTATKFRLKQTNDKLVFQELLDTYPPIANINLLMQYYTCRPSSLEELQAKDLSRSSMPSVYGPVNRPSTRA